MIAEAFITIGYIVLFINTMLFFVRFNRKGKAVKIFALYSLTMFIVQMAAIVVRKLYSDNLFLSHFYFILQFVFLSFLYLELLKEPFQRKIVKICLIICPIILALNYVINPYSFFVFSSLETFITSMPLIVYATFHLYNLLNELKEFYYINLGLLIYLFGSTVVFLVGNLSVAMHSESSFEAIWDLNAYLYVLYQLFILYEWKTSFYQTKQPLAS